MKHIASLLVLVLTGVCEAQQAVSIDMPEGASAIFTRRKTDTSIIVRVEVPLSSKVFVRGSEVVVVPGTIVSIVIPPEIAYPPLPPGMTREQINVILARIGKMVDYTRDLTLCPEKVPVLAGPTP